MSRYARSSSAASVGWLGASPTKANQISASWRRSSSSGMASSRIVAAGASPAARMRSLARSPASRKANTSRSSRVGR